MNNMNTWPDKSGFAKRANFSEPSNLSMLRAIFSEPLNLGVLRVLILTDH